MATIVDVTVNYATDPDALFRSALRFSEMTEAMEGMAIHPGLPASDNAFEMASFRYRLNCGHSLRTLTATAIMQEKEAFSPKNRNEKGATLPYTNGIEITPNRVGAGKSMLSQARLFAIARAWCIFESHQSLNRKGPVIE